MSVAALLAPAAPVSGVYQRWASSRTTRWRPFRVASTRVVWADMKRCLATDRVYRLQGGTMLFVRA